VCERKVFALFQLPLAVLALAGCGAQSSASLSSSQQGRAASAVPSEARTAAAKPVPALVVTPLKRARASWRAVAWVHGKVAASEAARSGVTLLRFEPQLVRLDLHAGEGEPSGAWRYGARIEPSEIHHVVAAFNGGFKFNTGDVGWMAQGRVALPLQSGRGSIVTYADGTTAIGAWNQGVPASGKPIESVLQNLALLVDRGVVASNAQSCIQSCWGSTVGNVNTVARSGLGITPSGQLVWAAGEHLVPADLARALIGAGVQRAVELDINPDWVAGYLYVHGTSGPGISGRLLTPYTRDFFAVVAR
jgi:hypothetical protein